MYLDPELIHDNILSKETQPDIINIHIRDLHYDLYLSQKLFKYLHCPKLSLARKFHHNLSELF